MPKAVHLLVNQMLPERLRSNDREYNKKEINELVREVSVDDPDRYADFVNSLKDLGRKSVYLQGATLRLDDFEAGFDKQAVLDKMDAELAGLDLIKDDKRRHAKRMEIYTRYTDKFTDLAMKHGRQRGSALAGIIASGARGNPGQYRSMIATPGVYMDYKDEPIDMFVRRSFADGVRPIDYLASTFGTRSSVIATKNSTADAGDLGKLLVQNALPIMVNQERSSTPSGIMLDPDEDDLRGRVLARNTAGFPAGTVVSRKVEAAIRNKHGGRVMVYSPLSEIGGEGISGEAFGVDYTGNIPGKGFAAGVTAGNSISEPIAQCLDAYTRVRMADNSTKFICDIEPGEFVWGVDKEGRVRVVEVLNRFDNGMQECYEYTLTDGEASLSVVCTPNHKVLQQRGSAHGVDKISEVDKHDTKVLCNVDGDVREFIVTDIQHAKLRHVFDLEVDHPDHLFVLESGLIVHNSSLNQKHSGGAYSGGKKVFSGFDYLSQFVQVPDSFKDRAALSEVAGRVEKIEDAPQGGKYVTVDNERHYVLPDMEVTVKQGDEVEPGDVLSDGLANPKDVIRLRGLGEGRRYYSRRLKQLLDDSGQPAQLRNTEVIARGALDAVQITDPDFEGHIPDSVTSYNRLEADWKPRDGHEDRLTRQSEGRYLETPLLHYTVGTKLTPRMLNELEEAGYETIKTHHKPPPFEPLQIRLRTQSYEVNPDWLARTGSSYLQKNLAESAQRGYDTNLKENTHPYPRLAVGEGFGVDIERTGKF